jgi:hypothetical protein
VAIETLKNLYQKSAMVHTAVVGGLSDKLLIRGRAEVRAARPSRMRRTQRDTNPMIIKIL